MSRSPRRRAVPIRSTHAAGRDPAARINNDADPDASKNAAARDIVRQVGRGRQAGHLNPNERNLVIASQRRIAKERAATKRKQSHRQSKQGRRSGR